MYKYKINSSYDKIPLEIVIEKAPLNTNGFADILSINLEYTHKLNRAKNRITEVNSFIWEDVKKNTNPYEFIYAFNSKNKGNDYRSVANVKPLSRSFFKMIEMIYEFCPSILNKENNKVISTHLAEGPGGFIEAVRYIRKGKNNDIAFGMTLVRTNTQYSNHNSTHNQNQSQIHIPGWKQSNHFLFNNPEVHIIYGVDGTGDLYKSENIYFLYNEMRKYGNENLQNAELITADGGFDFSIDYNYQEQSSCKLIFSQILGALKCQRLGGIFICKFFDINSYFTVEMLYLLYTTYESVIIYKPYTSRIANSEKYIVCSNFKGIEPAFLTTLFDVLDKWNKYSGETINHMFKEIPLPFIENIKTINKEIIDCQVKSIHNAIDIIKNKKLSDKQWIESNIEKQIKNAKEWCKKYNIPYREI